MEELIDNMMDVQINPQCICTICKDTTYEFIEGSCSKNCEYVCHMKCLKNWVEYRVNKKENVHCPCCLNDYSKEIIHAIINKNRCFLTRTVTTRSR